MSFRIKTILGIAAIEIVVMGVIIILNQFNFGGTASDQFETRARTTAGLLSTLLADSVIATDLATVDSIVDSVLENDDLIYVRVTNPTGFVLAQGGDTSALSVEFTEDASYEDAAKDRRFDVASPIGTRPNLYGFVQVGFSTSVVDVEIANAVRWNILGAGIGILLVAAFGNLLGTILIRQLSTLRDGAKEIGEGNLEVRIPVKGRDELSETARFFNQMADALTRDRKELMHRQDILIEKRDSVEELASEMLKIAQGQHVLDIPGVDREDEIGEMARATDVFQNVMQELEVARRDQDRLINAFDRVKDGVIVFDEDDQTLFANTSFFKMFSSFLETVDRNFASKDFLTTAQEANFFVPSGNHTDSELWLSLAAIFEGDETVKEFASRDNRRFLMHGSHVKGVGTIVTTTEVTELRASQAQVIHASKLSTLGEMAAGMAHELNQPLGVIRMSASNSKRRIIKGTAEDDYLLGKLERIASQTDRAAKIIDHMRVFGRKDEDAQVEFKPFDALRDAMELMSAQLSGTSIKIKNLTSGEDCRAVGPAIMFEQVLVNLISNARDAIVTQGDDPDTEAGTIEVSSTYSTKTQIYRICICDTGGGIPEDILEKLFEPFFTTKEPGKGTGLGLSISYSVVSSMQGEITATNTNDGASFVIEIPAYT